MKSFLYAILSKSKLKVLNFVNLVVLCFTLCAVNGAALPAWLARNRRGMDWRLGSRGEIKIDANDFEK